MEWKLRISFGMDLPTTLSSNRGLSASKTKANSTPTITKFVAEFPITNKNHPSSTTNTNPKTQNFSPTICFPASPIWSKWKRKRNKYMWIHSCLSRLSKPISKKKCFSNEAKSSTGWLTLTMNSSCSLKPFSVLSVTLISICSQRITGTMKTLSFWDCVVCLLGQNFKKLIEFLQSGNWESSHPSRRVKSSKDNQKLFSK